MTQQQARSDFSKNLDRHIKASRFAAIAWLVLSLPWLAYFTFAQDYTRLGILGFSVANQVFALALFRIGRHYAARVYWLSVQIATFLVGGYYLGGASEADLLFLFVLGLPFLFFCWRNERTTLIVFETLVLLGSIATFSFDWLDLHTQWFSYPATRHLNASPELYNFSLKLTVAVLLISEIAYFVRITQLATDAADDALQQSDEAARAKGEFLANMSHEIRTPMNGLVGMIEVLETTDLTDQQTRVIGTIRNSAFSLLRIVDDILDASKVEAGKLTLEETKTELRPLVEGVAQTLQTTSDQMGVHIRMLIDPELPDWIMTDPGRLRQILLNLLSNGVKYSSKQLTDRQGEVQMLAEMGPDDTLRFHFKDNGIGMSRDFLNKLFDPFTQAEASSHRIVGGTGLGLAITRSLIDMMGGSIAIDSAQNKGTEVTLDLPLAPVDGPSSMPDLSGLEVVCFDLLDEAARDGMKRLVSKAGAHISFVRNVEDMMRLDGAVTDKPIVLLPTSSDAQSKSLQTAVTAQVPNAKFVRFSSSRTARYGLLSGSCYLIQIFPMMTSELLQAIAVLAGRARGSDSPLGESAAHGGLAAPETETGLGDAKNVMILVAEDNEINQIVLSNQLDILGYPHDIAANGRDALTKWKSGLYDLVLTDCHMPLMDGFELTSAIRELETEQDASHTPIIAITANALAGEAEKCIDMGMDGYLAKPVELNELKKKLGQFAF
ncbi:ATP-binding protein [Thalassovita mangrovi]|uniref:Sensory/regulatory protein RpfC n=1 Tax=Thalassovita mangrovi TaxID=2692236 RepID=A0A6L8LGE9_9RHOB|nr:ATP-binding protein [Thalassovita mangrovi]MYM55008.1 response regulator [Thalassovita mangrovi]